MTELVQARVDKKIKSQATKIFHNLGLDMSTGIKIYLTRVAHDGGVPFQFVTENGFTPEQERQLLAESEETMRDYRAGRIKAAKSMKELKKMLLD